ncbi:hypothetical protein [Albibacterium bauzanense]|uniref:Sporulation and spore germination protein n=1 Tax=Albibacterium bauzanense TaxID=653929 RepID=A0A4R1M4K3_9SPHI|nr:hypothetical protein [Albibacterium bauzanense]TCK85814.1 hypothetical protein C8N28_1131 [Albibacterium bauzanense]
MNRLRIKFFLLVLSTLILLNGCMTDSSENNEVADTLSTQSNEEVENVSAQLPYEVNYNEETGRFSIVENPETETTSLNGETLANALKNKYPEIDLRLGDRRNDTLDVYIEDASYLTQNIGTAGANAYMAEATFAFTSLDSIKAVNFIFEAGDHASPGAYKRSDFDDFH